MTETEREYVLGTDAAELARLGFQHQVWAAVTAEAWERAGFRPGARLLDVGCGPGFATFDLADLVGPTGRVIAVDVSDRFLGHVDAERRRRGLEQIELRKEDLERLDVPEATVDGAWARWVLCWLRDPETVVHRVARALRPGGTFAVVDYAHYEAFTLAPPSVVGPQIFAAVARSARRHGGNLDVGLVLPAYMRRAGLEIRSVRPIVRVGRPGSALWAWPARFFANYLPSLVEMGEITAEEARAFETEWEERSSASDSFFLSPPMVEVIGVKPA